MCFSENLEKVVLKHEKILAFFAAKFLYIWLDCVNNLEAAKIFKRFRFERVLDELKAKMAFKDNHGQNIWD